ncbi:MAG TPA: FecR domain-containing protein [Candidatus Acidoferrum sp.]|nr:FecR domain-containing protein [Candidatus Acidoferrum sp.]
MNSQLQNDPHRLHGPEKVKRVEVYWHAVTYKTLILYGLLLAALIFGAVYFVTPAFYAAVLRKVGNVMGGNDPETLPLANTQAKFVNLDGRVQVKKVNSVQWADADYRTTLDKGDLIQTGSDGAARITFADTTSYTIKADTLVTVEENNVTRDQATTAVRINTGAVDLSTASSPNSHTAVSVEDTVAQIRPNSRASVKADPQSKESEIVVASGSAQVQRGSEKVELGQWQKANIRSGSPISTSDVLAPPDLSEPLNLEPILTQVPRTTAIHFEWKPVKDAVTYNLRISSTAMFTKILKDVKVSATAADVSGLDAGDYFWNVIAVDNKKQTSEVSETFKFTVVVQGKSQEMVLEIGGTQLHGRVAEIFGKTEPGAALIVNGQPVPNIGSDGNFRYFTEPLEPGEHTIVIVGQNRRGGTAKQQVTIVVPK